VSTPWQSQVRQGLPRRVHTLGLRGANEGSKHGQVLREDGLRPRFIEPADEGTFQRIQAPAMVAVQVGQVPDENGLAARAT
jgi:hypothetical protein